MELYFECVHTKNKNEINLAFGKCVSERVHTRAHEQAIVWVFVQVTK